MELKNILEVHSIFHGIHSEIFSANSQVYVAFRVPLMKVRNVRVLSYRRMQW